MIQLDYSYMMADTIGAQGITAQELTALQPQVAQVHEDLQQRRQAGLLPFYDLPHDLQSVREIQTLADEIAEQCDDFVVLGIGGSALGTTAVARALLPLQHNLLPMPGRRRPRLFVLDNIDPVGVGSVLELLDPRRTFFCVISKSGTTVETMSQFLLARDWLQAAVGAQYNEQMILITDPEKGVLRRLARDGGYRNCPVPEGVGGRFTVFTAVSLLPLAVAGVDIGRFLAGAAAFAPRVTAADLHENPAYLNAALQYLCYGKGMPISVMMPYSDRLRDVADWYRQLWAESLGKTSVVDGQVRRVGPTPVNALGATDQHSQVQLYMEGPFDKVVTFLVETPGAALPLPATEIPELAYLGGHSLGELLAVEQQATAAALARCGRPSTTFTFSSITPESLGAFLYLLQVQTVFAGGLFQVDPLDQPGVEAGKILTSALLGHPAFAAQRADFVAWRQGVTRYYI
jgi:glucose-6-phosphate isomerase